MRTATTISRRMALIEPFHVMEVQNRAQQLEAAGRNIVHMEIGQPDFGAAPQVVEAAIAALREQPMGYTSASGIPELRAALAEFYEQRYGISVSPQRVIVTAGASGAFLLALGALINAGDEVLMPDPCYPCNRHFVRLFDGIPVGIAVDEKQHYQPALADVQRHWGQSTRGILLASPSNPTGTLIAAAELGRIADWVHGQGGFVLIDEIYQGLIYQAASETALSLSQDIFVVNSFSKYFGMTGWRLGWMVAPEHAVRDIEKLAQNVFICPSAPAQHAALAAFRPETLAVLEERRVELQRRRDFMLPALRALGFSLPITPQGAFYLYAGCGRFGMDSSMLALRILEESGVAITPGLDFGSNRPDHHLRFAYTRSMADLTEGVERLARSPLIK